MNLNRYKVLYRVGEFLTMVWIFLVFYVLMVVGNI
jgi:hypothetical protein